MPIRRPAHGCHGYSSSRNSVLWAFSSLVVQFDQAPRLNRIQATSTRGVHARIRRVAGCATPTGSAGHAGATANLELTFHLDHSAGADQSLLLNLPLTVPLRIRCQPSRSAMTAGSGKIIGSPIGRASTSAQERPRLISKITYLVTPKCLPISTILITPSNRSRLIVLTSTSVRITLLLFSPPLPCHSLIGGPSYLSAGATWVQVSLLTIQSTATELTPKCL